MWQKQIFHDDASSSKKNKLQKICVIYFITKELFV